jgi:hypothetical protein
VAAWPASRKAAKALGIDRYFTAKACKNGHVRERITSNGHCIRCRTLAERKRLDQPRFAPLKAKLAARTRARRRLRMLTLIAGGPPRCARCGCDDLRFLEANHKNGGGGDERYIKAPGGARLPRGYDMQNAILNGTRRVDDLEVLCRPCNAIHWLELKHGPVPLAVQHVQPLAGLLSNLS